jgi:hypothetical protein
MREQINLVIDADVARLDAALPPIRARAACEFVARVHGIPADCAGVVFRISCGRGFYDFPASCNSNGEWTCRILPVAFPRVAAEWYEIRAVAADGQDTAIGRGRVLVGEWSAGTAGTYDARKRFVTTIFDEQGSQHAIWAVKNDIGEWTYKIGPVGEAEAVPADTIPADGGEAVYIRAIGEE